MRQLDLFGFAEQEPPVKKQVAPVAVELQLAEETDAQQPAKHARPVVIGLAEEDAVDGTTEVNNSTPQEENIIEFYETLFAASNEDVKSERPAPLKKETKVIRGRRGRKSFKDIDAEIGLVEVPDDAELFQKLNYPISQVAKWFNVNTSLLRFWENEFDILKPRKNRKGDRLFRPEDVKNLQVIYYLLRQRKFSIEGAKKYLKQNKSRAEVNIQLIQSLTKFRSFLLEMKANLGA